MIGLDTNVLLRAFVIDDGAQTQRALRFLERNCSSADPGYIDCVVLAETIWVLERSYRYSRSAIAHAIAELLDAEDVKLESEDSIAAALAAYPSSGVNLTDLVIAEINRRAGCSSTATFDRKAARRDGFRLVR